MILSHHHFMLHKSFFFILLSLALAACTGRSGTASANNKAGKAPTLATQVDENLPVSKIVYVKPVGTQLLFDEVSIKEATNGGVALYDKEFMVPNKDSPKPVAISNADKWQSLTVNDETEYYLWAYRGHELGMTLTKRSYDQFIDELQQRMEIGDEEGIFLAKIVLREGTLVSVSELYQDKDTVTAAPTLLIEELPTVSDFPKVEGKIVKAVRYTDITGENLILLTETDIVYKQDEQGNYSASKELFAYRFFLHDNYKQVWQVRDFVRDCEVDMTVSFVLDAFRITDLNGDSNAEIWMTYMLNCAGDISPNTMKIIMYEGEKKYAVRGKAKNDFMGGEYTMDAAFASGPSEFSDFAKEMWEKYKNQ